MKASKAAGRALPSVLIVSAYADPHVGGIEVLVSQQARTLAALGHEVTVVTSRCGDAGARHEQVDGYTVIRIAAWNGLEDRWGVPFPLWSPSAAWRVGRLVGHADVVHVHDVYYASSVLAASLAKSRRRPLFITQHVGLVTHDKAVVMLVQKLVYAAVGRLLWRWAVTITVYNPIVERFLSKQGVPARKVRPTANGVDTTTFRPGDLEAARDTRKRYGLEPDLPVILFVGRLVPKKGFERLLAACGPEYQLVLVGPGKIPSYIPPGVRFLGPIDRGDLLDLYRASDIFAFPAVGELLTLAMQEAMACGLPVVTTAEEAYSAYNLDPSGIALIEPEPEKLRSTFLEILSNPDRMQRMRAYSRQLAQDRFDWRRNAANLAADYSSAYGSRQQAKSQEPVQEPEISE
jgi:D-inositol-3-phosphate glycosyltransferase